MSMVTILPTREMPYRINSTGQKKTFEPFLDFEDLECKIRWPDGQIRTGRLLVSSWCKFKLSSHLQAAAAAAALFLVAAPPGAVLGTRNA